MCNDYYPENEEKINPFDRLEDIEATLNRLTFIVEEIRENVEEIREKVDEKSFRKKIETANRLIKTSEDLDQKVTENMKRLNDMLLKLKGCVAVAIGNMSN